MREVQALQVAHPSIIQVRDHGEESDFVYLVTDFIEGQSLREVMTAAGPMPWPRLSRLAGAARRSRRACFTGARDSCAGESRHHACDADDDGERLLISSAGVWQAQDLLPRSRIDTLRGVALADAELRYTAPELMTGRSADALGRLHDGRPGLRWRRRRFPTTVHRCPTSWGNMLRGEPAAPRTLQPSLPASASAALLRALRPAPTDRFATAQEFGLALLGH
jgi:hypothetical protein